MRKRSCVSDHFDRSPILNNGKDGKIITHELLQQDSLYYDIKVNSGWGQDPILCNSWDSVTVSEESIIGDF